eukprot:1160950-Pelagomonas_calceolata.AAC.6
MAQRIDQLQICIYNRPCRLPPRLTWYLPFPREMASSFAPALELVRLPACGCAESHIPMRTDANTLIRDQ